MPESTTTTSLPSTSSSSGSRFFRTDIGDITINNYNQLRVIRNNVLLAKKQGGEEVVVLGETLFKQKVVAGEYGDFCQLAYFNDVSVGGLIAKRESPLLIQIEFLGVLPHYRKQGLGAKLLRFLETISRKSLSNTNTIVELQCKISLSDSASRAFFVDKNGFVVKETLSSSESNSNNNNNSQSLILSKFISKD